MGFKCKRQYSISKRKNIGCKGCKYYVKINLYGNICWRCTC